MTVPIEGHNLGIQIPINRLFCFEVPAGAPQSVTRISTRHKHVNLSLKGMDGEPTRKTDHPDLPRRWVCPPSDPLPSVWGVSWDANSTWAPAALGRSCRPWAKDEWSWIDLFGIGSKQNNLWGLQWISKSLGNTVLLGKNNSFKPSAQTNHLLFPTCQIKNPYIDSKTRSHTNTQICRRTIYTILPNM